MDRKFLGRIACGLTAAWLSGSLVLAQTVRPADPVNSSLGEAPAPVSLRQPANVAFPTVPINSSQFVELEPAAFLAETDEPAALPAAASYFEPVVEATPAAHWILADGASSEPDILLTAAHAKQSAAVAAPAAPHGTNLCCGECQGSGCHSCCHTYGWIGGADLMALKPHFESTPEIFPSIKDGPIFNQRAIFFGVPLDYDYEIAPRVWLGYAACTGLGIRASYWHYDHAANAVQVANGIALQSANGSLRAQVADLEATQRVFFRYWSFLFTGGLRYVEVQQDGRTVNAIGTIQSTTINASHRFSGVGPTVSMEARRPLGDLNLAFYANGRFSVLFGNGKAYRQEIEQTVFSTVTNNFILARDDLVPIMEVGMGGEWARTFSGRRRLFLRAGITGQAWFGAGNAIDEDGNLGFFGFTGGAGFDY